MGTDGLGVGVIGFGGFALFAMQHFSQCPGVRLVGMACTYETAAIAAARRFGLGDPVPLEALCARDEVDLVYIATPPFLHCEQALVALNAGKHVICEKPLALTVAQAETMIKTAQERDLLLVANLMQRYNPLFDRIKKVVDSGVLGAPLHGYFENYATDEGLLADHWFWNRTMSGGIFVEHGVHFFDLFAGWLGEGTVEAAQVGRRAVGGMEDQVQCTVRYADDVLVNFYHGFTQPARLDRQELRLVFERGEVTLQEWVPARVRILAAVDEEQGRALMSLFPGARLDILGAYGAGARAARGHGKVQDIWEVVELRHGDGVNKLCLYGELLRAMMTDQMNWIKDRSHVRRVTEENGYSSLAMACTADAMAHRG